MPEFFSSWAKSSSTFKIVPLLYLPEYSPTLFWPDIFSVIGVGLYMGAKLKIFQVFLDVRIDRFSIL